MATYKCIKKGFYNGIPHGPGTGRDFIVVDKEFEKCPRWLEEVKTDEKVEESIEQAQAATEAALKAKQDELTQIAGVNAAGAASAPGEQFL